jgi:hypothetical protein
VSQHFSVDEHFWPTPIHFVLSPPLPPPEEEEDDFFLRTIIITIPMKRAIPRRIINGEGIPL